LRSRRSIVQQAGLALLAAAASAAVLGQVSDIPPADALAAYVAKPDDSYAWRVQRRYRHADAQIVELRLESQTWQDTLWRHQLLVIRPRRIEDQRHAALVVGGGRWRDEYETATGDAPLPEDGELFVAIARLLRSPVVVLGQVPFQPLFGMTEDRLIAHTFERYLATGDAEWPLLLPMVKSVVRAFDASSAASEREWGAPLERFTVLGGSKRGWTTWLTGAVDERAVALAPIVLDALNMERHFPHQTEAWGAPSEEIAPYTELGLHTVLGSTQGAALRQIVDPFSYRQSLTQPKLVTLATNDAYFPLDSANLYWDELAEPKYLLYLPNEQHSVERYEPFIRTLRALHAASGDGVPLPALTWELRWQERALELCIESEPEARRLRLWQAVSADRDFRDAEWHAVLMSRGGANRFEIERPERGYIALFGTATFGAGRNAFDLSTNLAVIPAAGEPSYGTQPLGVAGVCGAFLSSIAAVRP
jgi:PhoPQ-activated pathogenicity-related protein